MIPHGHSAKPFTTHPWASRSQQGEKLNIQHQHTRPWSTRSISSWEISFKEGTLTTLTKVVILRVRILYGDLRLTLSMIFSKKVRVRNLISHSSFPHWTPYGNKSLADSLAIVLEKKKYFSHKLPKQ